MIIPGSLVDRGVQYNEINFSTLWTCSGILVIRCLGYNNHYDQYLRQLTTPMFFRLRSFKVRKKCLQRVLQYHKGYQDLG